MKLLLIRHPEPDIPTGLCYGRSDVPPREDALADLVTRLHTRWRSGQHRRPLAVFSSPLQRCARVAHALAQSDLWPAPVIDARIAEMDFGTWEGKLWSELPAEDLAAWRASLLQVRTPSGESLSDVAARVQAFAEECLHAAPAAADDEVVLLTHAGIIQTLPRLLTGEPLSDFGRTRVDYGSITHLSRIDGGFRREAHNQGA